MLLTNSVLKKLIKKNFKKILKRLKKKCDRDSYLDRNVLLRQIFPLFSFPHLLVTVYFFFFCSLVFCYIVCCLALSIYQSFFVSICETVFVAKDFFFFSVSPANNPNYPQHLVSGFIFIVFFNFVLQWLLGSLSML